MVLSYYALNSEFTRLDFPSRGRREDFFLKYPSVLRNFPEGAKAALPSTKRIFRRSLMTPAGAETGALWLRLLLLPLPLPPLPLPLLLRLFFEIPPALVVLLLVLLLADDPIFLPELAPVPLPELAPVPLPELAPVPLLVLDKEKRSSRAFFFASLSCRGRAEAVTAENIPACVQVMKQCE